MYIITVTNQKGGTGKTSTALAIGEALRRRSYKVLTIDLDPQGNLTYTMRGNPDGINAMGILQHPETTPQEIQQTPQGELIAKSNLLSSADMILNDIGKEYRLRDALDYMKDDYDFCIIDTPPALGILTVNALTACNSIVIPALADIYSIQGIGQLNATLQAVKQYCNPKISILGILLIQFNKRSILKRDIAATLERTAGQLETTVFDTRIRTCQAIAEAQASRTGLFEYAPRSNAAKDYEALTDEIIERIKNR